MLIYFDTMQSLLEILAHASYSIEKHTEHNTVCVYLAIPACNAPHILAKINGFTENDS